MHVSCEVRLKLTDDFDRYAMLVRRNELDRSGGNHRLLQPFGGGIQAIAEDLECYEEVLGSIRQDDDLRFTICPEQREVVEEFFDSFIEERLISEARREFLEEAVDERELLTVHQVEACDFTLVRRPVFDEFSVRHHTWGEPTLYMIAVVQVHPPDTDDSLLCSLLNLSAPKKSLLEFVPRNLLETGGVTEKDSTLLPMYRYLV